MIQATYTLSYATLELLNDESYGLPVDVYTFGLLIYEMRKGLYPVFSLAG
jgi:serine/threonine protein kinase